MSAVIFNNAKAFAGEKFADITGFLYLVKRCLGQTFFLNKIWTDLDEDDQLNVTELLAFFTSAGLSDQFKASHQADSSNPYSSIEVKKYDEFMKKLKKKLNNDRSWVIFVYSIVKVTDFFSFSRANPKIKLEKDHVPLETFIRNKKQLNKIKIETKSLIERVKKSVMKEEERNEEIFIPNSKSKTKDIR